jgi:hypothetical protein
MLKENMIHRMNLFITKGVCLQVHSRKEVYCEEVSSGIGAHEENPSSASSWFA